MAPDKIVHQIDMIFEKFGKLSDIKCGKLDPFFSTTLRLAFDFVSELSWRKISRHGQTEGIAFFRPRIVQKFGNGILDLFLRELLVTFALPRRRRTLARTPDVDVDPFLILPLDP